MTTTEKGATAPAPSDRIAWLEANLATCLRMAEDAEKDPENFVTAMSMRGAAEKWAEQIDAASLGPTGAIGMGDTALSQGYASQVHAGDGGGAEGHRLAELARLKRVIDRGWAERETTDDPEPEHLLGAAELGTFVEWGERTGVLEDTSESRGDGEYPTPTLMAGRRLLDEIAQRRRVAYPISGPMQIIEEDGYGLSMAVTSIYAAAQKVMAGAGPMPLAGLAPWAESDEAYAQRLAPGTWVDWIDGEYVSDTISRVGEAQGIPRARLVLVEG